MIKLTKAMWVAGADRALGTVLSLAQPLEADLVYRGCALWSGDDPTVADDLTRELVFSGDFYTTVIPEIGPPPTWRTDSSVFVARPTVWDHLGVTRYCQYAEARCGGARRGENLFSYPNTLTNAAWVAVGDMAAVVEISDDAVLCGPEFRKCYKLESGGGTSNALRQTFARNGFAAASGVLRKAKHTLAFDLCAGTASTAVIQLYVSGGAVAVTRTVTLTAGWQRFAITGTPDGTSTYSALVGPGTAGTIYVRETSAEDMAGVTADASGNVPPSNYISRNEITYFSNQIATYHGVMVDGVEYFDDYNGNTIDNATGRVTQAAGTPIDPDTMTGPIEEPPMPNHITQSETFSTWTAANCTKTTLQGTAPDGTVTPSGGWTMLTEDTSTTTKTIVCNAAYAFANNCNLGAQVKVKAGTQSWIWLGIINKAGTTRRAWFNLTTGAVGNEDSGMTADIRVEGDHYVVFAWCAGSTGGTTPQMQIGMASGNGTTSYLGTSKTVYVWGAAFIPKEHSVTHIPVAAPADQNAATRTGYERSYQIRGLNRNDISMYYEMWNFWNSGLVGKTSDGVTQAWFYGPYMRGAPPHQLYHRMGQSFRPYADTDYTAELGYQVSVAAWDCYLGNSLEWFMWEPNTFYPEGAFVIPTATKVNNASPAQKLFRNKRAGGGASGATEPGSWPTGFPSATIDDGTCIWQCDFDNRHTGIIDPNDGVSVVIDAPAYATVRGGWWKSSLPEIGAYINGVRGYRHTEPFPIDGSEAGDLHVDMWELKGGHDSGSYTFSSQGWKRVRLWNRVLAQSAFEVLTQVRS